MRTDTLSIAPEAVFLVSGGARGITAQCVIRLAATFHCGFILLGRTSVADPEPPWASGCRSEAELKKQMAVQWRAEGRDIRPRQLQAACRQILARREVLNTLQAILDAGGRAVYVCADVADGQTLGERLAEPIEQMGPVSGIIHGAGNLADKRIEEKTGQDFENVYGAKITGLQNMLACVSLQSLKDLVLFTSAAGFFGNAGQTDYALANEMLNKIAHQLQRRYPSCRVLALNWGPWDGGMVTPELKRFFERRQVELIPIAAGTRILADALQNNGPVQVVVGSQLPVAEVGTDALPQIHRIHRKLTLAANPFLQDHVVGGLPVLPIACVMAWIGQTCQQCYPGFRTFACRNYRVLKGIVFDQTLADEYVVELRKRPDSPAGEIVLDTCISSADQHGHMRYHYRAELILKRELPEAPTCTFSYSERLDWQSEVPFYGDGTLFHGPLLQGIRQVLELGADKVVLACEAPLVDARQQGQFPVNGLNPFAADVGFQSMLIWVRSMFDAGSLPFLCGSGEQFKTVPFGQPFYSTMQVVSVTQNRLVADIVTHDENGSIYNRICGAAVTISKQLDSLFLQNRLHAEALS